jgi:hypothetical protein
VKRSRQADLVGELCGNPPTPRLMRNTYKHEPIAYHEDIRILKILHGEEGSMLQCMLFPSANATGTGKGTPTATRVGGAVGGDGNSDFGWCGRSDE